MEDEDVEDVEDVENDLSGALNAGFFLRATTTADDDDDDRESLFDEFSVEVDVGEAVPGEGKVKEV